MVQSTEINFYVGLPEIGRTSVNECRTNDRMHRLSSTWHVSNLVADSGDDKDTKVTGMDLEELANITNTQSRHNRPIIRKMRSCHSAVVRLQQRHWTHASWHRFNCCQQRTNSLIIFALEKLLFWRVDNQNLYRLKALVELAKLCSVASEQICKHA